MWKKSNCDIELKENMYQFKFQLNINPHKKRKGNLIPFITTKICSY